jgi:hypothetical protein
MKTKLTVWAGVLFLLVACTQQTITRGSFIRLQSEAPKNAAVSSSAITVFFKQEPDFDYLEIGIVEGIAIGKNAGLGDLIPELQRQAALMGAAAIHKIEIQRYNQTGDALHATAVAIVKK